MHRFVGLYAVGIIIDAGLCIFCILVVGEEYVHFVAVPFVAEFYSVVGGRGHCPVIVTQDTLVVILKALATNFGEQSGFVVLHGEPTFGEAQCTACLSPNTGELW